ncbi:hypothetical protein [uncultured Methanoregula sp.]|uniref:hypothetical protein n=1 Tax=uncultured Methanoregula sp. TaxID=1005933 RepID=UPI002AAB51D9|nr:hypothetical protein [uncultured Methanoregula sp.]
MSMAGSHNQSPIKKVFSYLGSESGVIIIVTSLLLAIFLIDAITPLGIPVWLLYFIPLVLSYWSCRPYAIPVVFFITLTLLICGLILSPPGVPLDIAIGYRSVFFFIFLFLSLMLGILQFVRNTKIDFRM